ncbi:salt tolerance down-regulator-domain-containing protein [Mycena latifolia]|nr:salt tolerance down-regulator-domain-containing protein [Mycena latifolia]
MGKKKHGAPKAGQGQGHRQEGRGRKGEGKEEDGAALTAAALAATNELIATAKELYMSLGGGESGSEDGAPANGKARACEGEGGGKEREGEEEGGDDAVEALLGADAAYWRALPRSVREFVGGVYKMQGAPAGGLSSGEFARSVRAAAAALVPSSNEKGIQSPTDYQEFATTALVETIDDGTQSGRTSPMAPSTPSSVSIGKKPMAYAQQPAAPPAPRSARAQAKAPVSANSTPNPNPTASPNAAAGAAGYGAAEKAKAPANNKIWSTSSSEERERIRDFWLALAEDERRDLVKVEKDTVLRKMKEQQKHSCSCAVCGRKRNAIEEELQVLYDAYYEDLEQYALYQQQYLSSNRTLPPPPGPGPFPGSVEVDRYGAVVAGAVGYPPAAPAPGRRRRKGRGRRPAAVPEEEDVYEEEEEPSEEGEEEEGEEPPPPPPVNGAARRGAPPARGGGRGGGRGAVDLKGKIAAGVGAGVGGPTSILTVADDLLKNDGQKFLEMMEQLVRPSFSSSLSSLLVFLPSFSASFSCTLS